MDKRIIKYNRWIVIAVFIIAPALIYILSDFPRRSILKEVLSILTLGAFFVMLLQFYMSRANKAMLSHAHKMVKVLKWHKILGYVFVSVLLLHPFLIVVPRFFEAGVDPQDAFLTILNHWSSKGLILGISAWVLMLVIGLTSAFRNELGISYVNWRLMHGILSIIFIAIASLHVIALGRHANQAMVVLISLIAALAIVLQLKVYRAKPTNHKPAYHE